MASSPLPLRAGVDPTRVRLPSSGHWVTALEYMLERFPRDQVRLREVFAAREVVDQSGAPLDADSVFVPGGSIYLYRDLPHEHRVPFEIEIIHQDRNLVVIDKPHFLATIPKGSHVRESVLVRLRVQLGIENLSPVHRLDRLTAGVLILTTQQGVRGAYQKLFQNQQVRKVYHAFSNTPPDSRWPHMVESRIVRVAGRRQAVEVPGSVNARTEIVSATAWHGGTRFVLAPASGKTHQLRIHLASLGAPIAGDPLYPVEHTVASSDFTTPLQLLAKSVEFDDPFTGERRRFISHRELDPR